MRVRTERGRDEFTGKTKTENAKPEACKKGKTGSNATLTDLWIAEHYEGLEDFMGKEGLLATRIKAVVERVLEADLTHHLGYAPGGAAAERATAATAPTP